MLARSIALVVAVGMLAAAVAGGCGSSAKGVASNSVGSGGTAGSPDAGAESSAAGGPQGCTDGVKNGSETDVDCGGSCPPCKQGQACTQDADCGANACHNGQCCSTSTYTESTGLITGVASVCCKGNDLRTDIQKCGDGQNYFANPQDPNCAQAVEGANDNGSACAQVTCESFDCSAAP